MHRWKRLSNLCNAIDSLVSGPLSETSAFLAKVSTSPTQDTPNYQHVICLYIPNVYDKDEVLKVKVTLSDGLHADSPDR
jgi:hypothetical protein